MNELSFLDLAVLKKVDAESSVEKFGSIINTSFFETANLLGTIKIKGYVNIESSVGGISRVTMTDAGSSLLSVAEQRAKEPIDPLDNAILHALAGGAKELDAMQSQLTIRGADLAFHLNKLAAQGYIDYALQSGKVSFVLTEQGFNSVGGVRVQQKLQPEAQEQTLRPTSQEESEELPPRKEPSASSPPWVNPSDVKIPEKKEDVLHILKGEHREHHEEHKHGHHEEHKHGHHEWMKRPLTQDEEKALEKRRRLYSKIEHYLVEYAPYAILVLVVLAIFLGAIYLSITKIA